MGTAASSLPYSISEQKVGDDGNWSVHEGAQKSDGKPVTVFQAQKPALKDPYKDNPMATPLQAAQHHFQNCKKLRHPYILSVEATLDTDNPTNDESLQSATTGALIIVTEKCIPLTEWLRTTNPSRDQLAWGLQCIVQSISFLHNSAQLAHGCICPSSFWVTPSGDVKLWNFSLVTLIGVADGGGGPTHHFKDFERILTPQAYRSPERVQQQWGGIATSGVHAMDSYSLGILIHDYYNNAVPGPLQKATQRLQTKSLKMRPRLGPLLRCPVFDTPYAKLLQELEELHIQPVEQKLRFWQTLNLEATDSGVLQHKLLPMIETTITTICGSESMLSQDLYRREVLAMVNPLFFIADHVLDEETIGKQLTPLMQLLFTVKDRAVRGALLSKTSLLAQHMPKNNLNQSVFEPLCSGFSDSSDALRELTLKATAVLVPHLYPPNVEKLSRYLVRLQSDASASIRTHAMTMIPSLGPHLSVVAREKLLLPAFVRAFKDPHAPCRLAALTSIAEAKPYFSMEELATKVLPAVMPLVLDAIPQVRTNAFQVVEAFLAELKQEHKKRGQDGADQLDMVQTAGAVSSTTANPGAIGTAPSSGGAQPVPAPNSGSYLSSLSSWYSSSTVPDSAPPATAGTGATTAATQSAPPVAPAPPTRPAPAFSSLSIGGDAIGSTGSDGWDDDDDDLFDGTNSPAKSTMPSAANGMKKHVDENDVFASFNATSAASKSIVAGRSGGKLIMKKSGAGSAKVTVKKPEVKKLDFLDDDADGDGWDDF